ncbi:uncharacterized protein LOC121299467 isoform X2 [Polyodon spathula]|uniref:uncharacterized protein LOC121299467 isoform X2 n=1 Tax=Polyodon spathula TaxID=7913 RepID=UPI001B7EEB2E|nr:uncharacterized protein LOC121299467 isoform X2 [Polyodon spathula]
MGDKEENKDLNVEQDAFDRIGKKDVAETGTDSRRLINSLTAETGGITVGPSIQANNVSNINYYITARTALEEPDLNKRKMVCQQNYKKEVEKNMEK